MTPARNKLATARQRDGIVEAGRPGHQRKTIYEYLDFDRLMRALNSS
jgi:hypothetical protein